MAVAVRSEPRGLWRHPDFLKLWTGQTVSLFGSLITGIALPFAAILLLGASPTQIALLGAARLAAGLIAGPFAGVWVDRLPRRPLLIATDLGRALLLGSIPLAAALGLLHIEQLYLVTLLTGMLGAIFDVAYRSYLPSLVRRDELVEGNSKLEASGAVAEVAGFGLGGLLVQALTAPIAILIDALSFLVSAVSLIHIRAKEPRSRSVTAADEKGAVEPGSGPGIRGEIGEGLRLVLRDPVLRAVVGAAGTLELFRNMIGVVLLLYLTNELALPPAAQGAIFAVGGISSLGGALVAERVTRRFGLGRALVGGLLVSGIATTFLPLAGGPVALAVVLLVVQQILGDGASTTYAINQTSLIQASTPDRFLGRTNASVRLVEVAATLISLALGAFLGERFGLRPTLWVAAIGVLLAPLWLLYSPVRGLRRLPEQAG